MKTYVAIDVDGTATPFEVTRENEYSEVRSRVGGYIEMVGVLPGGLIVYGDEEGVLKQLPLNPYVSGLVGRTVVGPVVVVGPVDGDGETSGVPRGAQLALGTGVRRWVG